MKGSGGVFGITTGYGLDERRVRVRVPVASRVVSSPHHPDWLWGPLSLLSNIYLGFYSAKSKTVGA
jgi:hypothetical protein